MAVTDIANSNLTFTGVPLGVQVTKVTDSSADWASVANSTYFYDKTDKLIHFKNSGGTVLEIFSTAGLTYFTEAQATTSPNNTVYVDSLTATGSTTNVDVAIVPKGTGAFMLAVPDNGSTGGNKRGQYAVDLCLEPRYLSSEVASGKGSFTVGRSQTASGDWSVAIGNNNRSTAPYAVSIGSTITTSGTASITVGNGITSGNYSANFGFSGTVSGDGSFQAGGQGGLANTVSGTNASAIGCGLLASGNQSSAFNYLNTASGSSSFIHGTNGSTFSSYGRYVQSTFGWSQGDSQMSRYVFNKRTTDATPTIIHANALQLGANSSTQVLLQNNSALRFKGTIIGKKSGTTDIAAWDIDGLIVRGANAASTTLNISNVTLVQNTPAWGTPTLAADTTNGCLQVQVTGAAATNIQWTAVIETTEVIYA